MSGSWYLTTGSWAQVSVPGDLVQAHPYCTFSLHGRPLLPLPCCRLLSHYLSGLLHSIHRTVMALIVLAVPVVQASTATPLSASSAFSFPCFK